MYKSKSKTKPLLMKGNPKSNVYSKSQINMDDLQKKKKMVKKDIFEIKSSKKKG